MQEVHLVIRAENLQYGKVSNNSSMLPWVYDSENRPKTLEILLEILLSR
jgi:hypothetical protein